METILLADDERIFKAVEGTCLRRERCRLLKAPADRLMDVAVERHPDLLLTCFSDDASRRTLRRLCAESSLLRVPIIVIDFKAGTDRTARPVRRPRHAAALETIHGGAARLDSRLDAAIKRNLPVLDRANDRLSVSVPVRCRAERASFTVRTKNISPSGLFLKTETPLAPGERFAISFSIPARPAGDDETRTAIRIRGTCEVVRHVLTGARGEYDDLIPGMGVRFVDLEPASRSTLTRFVRAGRTAGGGHGSRPALRQQQSH